MQETLIQGATQEPVSLALAKQYLRVTHSLEDDIILSMISSARKMCEDVCRISISPQRWKANYRLPIYKNDSMGLLPRIEDPERIKERCALPRPPVVSINSVTLTDRFANQYTFPNYVLDPDNNWLIWTDPRVLIYGFYFDELTLRPNPTGIAYGPYGVSGIAPRPAYMEVDFYAGYPLFSVVNPGTTPTSVQAPVVIPPDLTQAILLVLSSLYENRGDDETTIPKKALIALRPYFYSTRSAG